MGSILDTVSREGTICVVNPLLFIEDGNRRNQRRQLREDRNEIVATEDTKPTEGGENQTEVDEAKRKLLKQIEKGVYVAPIALAMLTTTANASDPTC